MIEIDAHNKECNDYLKKIEGMRGKKLTKIEELLFKVGFVKGSIYEIKRRNVE